LRMRKSRNDSRELAPASGRKDARFLIRRSGGIIRVFGFSDLSRAIAEMCGARVPGLVDDPFPVSAEDSRSSRRFKRPPQGRDGQLFISLVGDECTVPIQVGAGAGRSRMGVTEPSPTFRRGIIASTLPIEWLSRPDRAFWSSRGQGRGRLGITR